MEGTSRASHWQAIYTTKGEGEVSWFEERASVSLDLLREAGAVPSASIIDVGGGASRLVDALLEQGYGAVTVLDVSEAALARAKSRLGAAAAKVTWIVADITTWEPPTTYDIWHDRAAFHFLTEESDRAAYLERLRRAVRPGGHAIIATFALDGPERCSGLPVMRYDGASLSATIGPPFELMKSVRHVHRTPAGGAQNFQFSLFCRR